jgi:transaldolase
MHGMEARIREIGRLIAPLPVAVEVTCPEPDDAIRQALIFAGWGDNVIVKVTIHGPNGEDTLQVAHELETNHNVRVNVTAMMSAQQCLLAALAGASYLSLFGGRVNNMGYNVCAEITKLRRVLDLQGLKGQIILGSAREVLNVIEWLEAGAHIVTVTPSLLEGMMIHPYSKETIQMFLRDAASAEASVRVEA